MSRRRHSPGQVVREMYGRYRLRHPSSQPGGPANPLRWRPPAAAQLRGLGRESVALKDPLWVAGASLATAPARRASRGLLVLSKFD